MLSNFFKNPARKKTVHISCLVDNQPIFRLQAWNWLLSLRATQTTAVPFVHYTPDALAPDERKLFSALGAHLYEVPYFGKGHAKYCNKINQLTNPHLLDADYVILTDADLFFSKDPKSLAQGKTFRAKPVDMPNPPEDIWRKLVVQAGFEKRVTMRSLELDPGTKTFHTNFNGGLYIIPGSKAAKLHERWHSHARNCLQQEHIMGQYLLHSDQMAMGLALLELGLNLEPLPTGANLPTHLGAKRTALIPNQDVSALHYHRNIDEHGLPKLTGVDWIDAHIQDAREVLTEGRRENFSNSLFWDFRHQMFPQLGSGLGSRGEIAAFKTHLLTSYALAIGNQSVLDVGCGDLEVLASVPFENYKGIDVSQTALDISAEKRPDWTFTSERVSDIGSSAHDYTLCLDVFIHQPSLNDAQELAMNLLRVTKKGLIFSVHSKSITASNISFDSSAVLDFITSQDRVNRVLKIGEYRDVTIYFAELSMGDRLSPHDIGIPELAVGSTLVENMEELREIVTYSQEKIGFFPVTVIRTHEYYWFNKHLVQIDGKKLLDVGAGVSFLPFRLADRGAFVTTVDLHPLQRNEQQSDQWNEWGFLDYGKLDSRIRSFNIDMAKLKTEEKFDIIYSVSVIEHMPRTMREQVIDTMLGLLKKNGTIYLSLDLIPNTRNLWNFSEGKVVDKENHGSADELITQFTQNGFSVLFEDLLCGVSFSRTDVMYLVLQR